jgi:hypothetical protein
MSGPGAPDVPRTRGIDLGELGLSSDFITDNRVLYENLQLGDTLHTALAKLFTGRRRPTENEVYKTVKDFRDWLVTNKPLDWSAFKRSADNILSTGKERSDTRAISAAQAAAVMNRIGVPADVVKRIVGTVGIPKREQELALAAAEKKQTGTLIKKGKGTVFSRSSRVAPAPAPADPVPPAPQTLRRTVRPSYTPTSVLSGRISPAALAAAQQAADRRAARMEPRTVVVNPRTERTETDPKPVGSGRRRPFFS